MKHETTAEAPHPHQAGPAPTQGLPMFRSSRVPRPEEDPVNHPRHYRAHISGVECIELTEAMGFNLGNALKYLWRLDLKGNAVQDLHKAAWYIRREIDRRKAGRPGPEGRPAMGAEEIDLLGRVAAGFPHPIGNIVKLLWWADVDAGAMRLLEAAHELLKRVIAEREGRE